MGELVDFAKWKKRKADEAHAKELEEIAELREEIKQMMDDMGEPEIGPYYERESAFSQRLMDISIAYLNGYSTWPIDSSDM